MRSRLFLILCIGIILSVSGCNGGNSAVDSDWEEEQASNMVTMTGRVLRGGSDGSACLLVVKDTPYWMKNRTKDKSFELLETGDLLEISYDGTVMYSYPMQVDVYDFEKIEDGSEADVSQEAITALKDIGWKFPE